MYALGAVAAVAGIFMGHLALAPVSIPAFIALDIVSVVGGGYCMRKLLNAYTD